MTVDNHVLRLLTTPEGASSFVQSRSIETTPPEASRHAIDPDHLESGSRIISEFLCPR